MPVERRVKARRAAQKWHAATAAAAREAEEQAQAAAAEAQQRALEERRRVDRRDAGFTPPVAGQVPPKQPQSPERPPPRPAPPPEAGAAAAAAVAASGGAAGEGAAEAGSTAAAKPESKADALRSALVGDTEPSAPLLELGCLLRAYICLDGCFELSRQACTAAASCLCGDPKLPASSHGTGKEHSSDSSSSRSAKGTSSSVQGSRRDFKLVGDFTNERPREEVRV